MVLSLGGETLIHVLGSYVPFHRRVGFLGVDRNRRLLVVRVVEFVRSDVANFFHVLPSTSTTNSRWYFRRSVLEITSTCSLDQPSMVSDLTLDMCVPSLRWTDAHRMHKNMPNCHQLAFCYV